MIPSSWIQEAAEHIRPYIHITPLTYDKDHDIFLKWENHQVTGSFKARGALNKVLSLQEWERSAGLVTASAGNHGQGVALAGNLLRAAVTIFASDHAVPEKVAAMRSLGADVRLVAGGYGEAEKAGLAYAQEQRRTWISPYNDGQVIAGQGTLASEILAQLRAARPPTWIVPVGGGGLISGIGAALQHLSTRPRLIGVQSEASPFFQALFYHGDTSGVVELPSLADGLAGPVEEGAVTIPLVKNYVDDILLVSEAEIRQAIAFAWRQYHERIEGSAAVSLAAILAGKIDSQAVLILSGGNIQSELHRQILENG